MGLGLDLEEMVVDGSRMIILRNISLALLQAWKLEPLAEGWQYSRREGADILSLGDGQK